MWSFIKILILVATIGLSALRIWLVDNGPLGPHQQKSFEAVAHIVVGGLFFAWLFQIVILKKVHELGIDVEYDSGRRWLLYPLLILTTVEVACGIIIPLQRKHQAAAEAGEISVIDEGRYRVDTPLEIEVELPAPLKLADGMKVVEVPDAEGQWWWYSEVQMSDRSSAITYGMVDVCNILRPTVTPITSDNLEDHLALQVHDWDFSSCNKRWFLVKDWVEQSRMKGGIIRCTPVLETNPFQKAWEGRDREKVNSKSKDLTATYNSGNGLPFPTSFCALTDLAKADVTDPFDAIRKLVGELYASDQLTLQERSDLLDYIDRAEHGPQVTILSGAVGGLSIDSLPSGDEIASLNGKILIEDTHPVLDAREYPTTGDGLKGMCACPNPDCDCYATMEWVGKDSFYFCPEHPEHSEWVHGDHVKVQWKEHSIVKKD